MSLALTPVTTVDLHPAGEPVRIVTAGRPNMAGETVADRRQTAIWDGSGQQPQNSSFIARQRVRG